MAHNRQLLKTLKMVKDVMSESKQYRAKYVPPYDYSLMTPKERDIGDTIHLFHDIAVRLGKGTFMACKYRIPYRDSPSLNPEVMKECLEDATPEELERIQVEHDINDKWIRLTPLLSDEEKATIRKYNRMANDYIFTHPPYSGNNIEEPDPTLFKQARFLYEHIMTKYNAKSYEDSTMRKYKAGTGIPEHLRWKP